MDARYATRDGTPSQLSSEDRDGGREGRSERRLDRILDELASSGLGTPVGLERLAGLSGATVRRVRFARLNLVIKVTSERTEFEFYRTVAPVLRARGIGIPELVVAGSLPDGYWLALEHIPEPLPSARWVADDDQMRALRRLHRNTLDLPDLDDVVFTPEWTTAMTESALAWLPAPVAARVRRLLRPIRRAALSLFRPKCFISGDPNPRNWGLRADGSLVLFDWERFGRATPAIDVAITIPGLPDRDVLTTVAAGYLGGGAREGRHALVRELAAAKVWSTVDFLEGARRPGAGPDRTVRHLCAELARWVDEMVCVVA